MRKLITYAQYHDPPHSSDSTSVQRSETDCIAWTRATPSDQSFWFYPKHNAAGKPDISTLEVLASGIDPSLAQPRSRVQPSRPDGHRSRNQISNKRNLKTLPFSNRHRLRVHQGCLHLNQRCLHYFQTHENVLRHRSLRIRPSSSHFLRPRRPPHWTPQTPRGRLSPTNRPSHGQRAFHAKIKSPRRHGLHLRWRRPWLHGPACDNVAWHGCMGSPPFGPPSRISAVCEIQRWWARDQGRPGFSPDLQSTVLQP